MKVFQYLIISIILLLTFSCTETPFFDDKINIDENLVINGRVSLSDGSSASEIYVWFEGFNLSDWTDINGNFSIKLPPAKSQAGGGLNGVYYLYVYTANYQYQKFDMLLMNGEFKYDTKYLDNKGNFYHDIVLDKIIDIQTSISPATIDSAYIYPITITVRLESLIDSVFIKTHFIGLNTPCSLLFLKQSSPIEEAVLLEGGLTARLVTIVVKNIVYWSNSFVFSSTFFNSGIYQVQPYIQIIQEGLPDELLLSIDENIYNADYHNLNWPIKQQVGYLTVVKLKKSTE